MEDSTDGNDHRCGKSKNEAYKIAKQGGLYIEDPLGQKEPYRVEPNDELIPNVSIKIDGVEVEQDTVDVPQFLDTKNNRVLLKLRRGAKQVAFFAITL